MFGNTVGGLIQIVFIIWTGIASLISLCCWGKVRHGWSKMFPRIGASSDFYRYEHIYKDKETYASVMKSFTKIPAAGSHVADGNSGDETCSREEFLKATNLKNKSFNMVRSDNQNV